MIKTFHQLRNVDASVSVLNSSITVYFFVMLIKLLRELDVG